jgi:hypothetical protein
VTIPQQAGITICTGRSAMARLIMLSAIDMPQPPQLVLPARRSGSQRSNAVCAMPPMMGSVFITRPPP